MFLRRHLYLYHFFGTRLRALERKITDRAGGERLYYPLDRHLTGQGHSVVARAIAEKLLEINKELFK